MNFIPSNLSTLLNQPQIVTDNNSLNGKMLDIDLITEDPNQPRKADNIGFSEKAIAELAESIKERGVKTPISVRENPEQKGHYIINHGARRYRASKIAGLTQIPAIIDENHTLIDQLVENLQRESLDHFEIAKAIIKLNKEGMKKQDIAKQCGKDPSWVSLYTRLENAPECILNAMHKHLINDVTIVVGLIRIYKDEPDEIELTMREIIENEQEFTRMSFKNLKDYLGVNKEKNTTTNNDPNFLTQEEGMENTQSNENDFSSNENLQDDSSFEKSDFSNNNENNNFKENQSFNETFNEKPIEKSNDFSKSKEDNLNENFEENFEKNTEFSEKNDYFGENDFSSNNENNFENSNSSDSSNFSNNFENVTNGNSNNFVESLDPTNETIQNTETSALSQKTSKPIIHVTFPTDQNGCLWAEGVLILDEKPEEANHIFVKRNDNGKKVLVKIQNFDSDLTIKIESVKFE